MVYHFKNKLYDGHFPLKLVNYYLGLSLRNKFIDSVNYILYIYIKINLTIYFIKANSYIIIYIKKIN